MHTSSTSQSSQAHSESEHKRMIENSISALVGLTNLDEAIEPNLQLESPALLLSQNTAPNTAFDATLNTKPTSNSGYSFFCANPTSSQTFSDLNNLKQASFDNPNELQAHNPDLADKDHIPFHSGWIGYLAYPNSTHKEETVEAEFHYYPWSICLDHKTNTFHLLGTPDNHAHRILAILKSDINSNTEYLKEFHCQKFTALWQYKDYELAFNKVQEYLKAGDCYQINLTQPFTSQHQGNPCNTLLPLYKSLNPSFGCYFKGKDCELVSVSPERFISINNLGHIEAKPIKGTIKRSSYPSVDDALITELKNSSKNQAENLMIVDLLRNDLSMSAKAGSVQVDKLFELESHPNVHHLVSTISAKLEENTQAKDAIINAFPGGSITGAPKKRAMEIIEELEAQPRSLYCGSFGYFSDSGNADFNILIRSLEFRDNTITCWGGGGITVDSDCAEEYEESLTKIRRIMDTLEQI